MKYDNLIYIPGKTKLSSLDASETGKLETKEEALLRLDKLKVKLADLQERLFAQGKHSLLIILQGMDASGKDGIVKHVMSGVNPQGFKIKSFSTPSEEESKHDFLWRCVKQLPERGHIGIFNRSYYEETLIVRIHPEFLQKQGLPIIPDNVENDEAFWATRFTDINNFEQYLSNNGIIVLKFFLNISKDEQKKRFLKRVNLSAKNWKFKPDDISERAHWERYMEVYDDMMTSTSTSHAPWHIIPANKKWFSRAALAEIIVNQLEALKIEYPEPTYKQKRGIIEAKQLLENELS